MTATTTAISSRSVPTMPPGAVLRRARFAKGMSQTDVGRRVGTCRSTVHQWEHSKCEPNPLHRARLLALFGIDPWAAS